MQSGFLDSIRAVFGIEDVRRAASRLEGVSNRTPVFTSRTLDRRIGGSVFLKAENLQRGGSFKFRGAYNKLATIPERLREAGVCAISSGNHAQALALAAAEFGVKAVILMPADAPSAKINATREYGAEVLTYDRYSIPQNEAGEQLRQETGLTFISSHDDPEIAAGAGTAGLELFDEVKNLDVVVAPIGGGGGMSGYATVAKALNPNLRVIGVEPAASGVTKRSLAAGERIRIDIPRTIADGQQLTTPGEFTFGVMQQHVDEVVVVEDQEIIDTIIFFLERMKLIVEPSGAIATAAVLMNKIETGGSRIGTVISGGNIGLDRLEGLLSKSMEIRSREAID